MNQLNWTQTRRVAWLVFLSALMSAMVFATMSASAVADSGAEYSFKAIWKLVRERAPEISAASHDLEGARIYEQRMSRHWSPRAFIEGRAFLTSDPALTFMSLLGQRQMGAADFNPQTLNQPGSGFFERGTLGLDFPLFEGGSKVAAERAAIKMTEAKSFELKSAEIAQYAEIANTYSSLISLQGQRSELHQMNENVDQILAQYKIGSKSNPVGYSGLLGLKNLRNRVEGLLAENSSKVAALRDQCVLSQRIYLKIGYLNRVQ